jgi:hypothetical protein
VAWYGGLTPFTVRFSGLHLPFRPLWEDPVLLVELPLVQRVDFNVDVRVLGAHALREMNLNDAIIIGPQPPTDRVQHDFQAAIEVSRERSGEVALKV